jgi:hypothetical protein
MRLGKKEHVSDPLTMMLGNFISPTLVYPARFDFDASRAMFPLGPWGNMEWGNCVVAGRANHLLRLERVEQRRTVPITDLEVIDEYKRLCEVTYGHKPENPGDQFDNGLNVLGAIKAWRNDGWFLKTKVRSLDKYTISAYGELDPNDFEQLKAAIFLLHGIQLGFWLPRAVQGNLTLWDYKGEMGPQWKPGSWGGHLVYAKSYSADEIEILTWGKKVRVTKRFIAKYCDEAWAVVDDLDYWRKRPEIDVTAMRKYLQDIGCKNIG